MNVELIPVTTFQQNCSLVWDDEKNAVIIDPGGESLLLIERIEALGLVLKAILLTHGHLDHVGAAEELKHHFGVKIIGPQSEDAFLFQSLSEQAARFGLSRISPFLPDQWLNDEGEKLTFGQLTFEVLHLPGHTPGHVGFIAADQNIAFTGDVLFQNSIGRTDFPKGDLVVLMSSIRCKLLPLDNDMIIVAGHGPCTTIGQEKKNNPYLIRLASESVKV